MREAHEEADRERARQEEAMREVQGELREAREEREACEMRVEVRVMVLAPWVGENVN